MSFSVLSFKVFPFCDELFLVVSVCCLLAWLLRVAEERFVNTEETRSYGPTSAIEAEDQKIEAEDF